MNGQANGASELQRVRETEGLSRAALARAAGVSDKTIERAEHSETVRRETKFKILKGLNLLSEHKPAYKLTDIFPDEQDS